jgi:hypothetical protein
MCLVFSLLLLLLLLLLLAGKHMRAALAIFLRNSSHTLTCFSYFVLFCFVCWVVLFYSPDELSSARRAVDKAGDVQENLSELEFAFKKRSAGGAARSAAGGTGRGSVGSSLLQETVEAKAPLPPRPNRPSGGGGDDFFGL